MNNEYKELTKEECSKLSVSELLAHLKNKPKVITVDDDILYTKIENLIEDNSKQLHGEYSFYCVYQKPLGSSVKYALIYAFYLENDVKEEDIEKIILADGQFMHQKLKEAKLDCDYFYVMPYFDYSDKTKGSVLRNDIILETNKLEEFDNIKP